MTANSGETLKQARLFGSAMRRRKTWPELLKEIAKIAEIAKNWPTLEVQIIGLRNTSSQYIIPIVAAAESGCAPAARPVRGFEASCSNADIYPSA